MQLSFLTDQQARQLIQQELANFFSSTNITREKNKESPNARVVDLDGLIKARPFIGSRSTIYKKVSRGEIPHSKSGKRLIFDLNIIDEWLLSNSIKTNLENEKKTGYSLRGRKRKRRS